MVYECWEGGQLYHNPLRQINTQKKTVEDPTTPTEEKPQKPMWTRIAFGAFHCGLGGLVAAFLLSQRASWVRSMTIVRPISKKAHPQLFIEVAGHPNGYGHPFSLSDCKLAPTHLNKDIMMMVVQKEGKFAFHPLGATVGGKSMPTTGDLATFNILRIWKNNGGQMEHKKQS